MNKRHILSAQLYLADADKNIPLFRVPDDHTITVEAAYAVTDTTLAAGTSNYYTITLLNGGTAGTATTAISAAAGGTPGWTLSVPKTIAITDGLGDLTAGQWLVVKYDETGTLPANTTTVCVEYVEGIGAKA